jgi:hypothetical protein
VPSGPVALGAFDAERAELAGQVAEHDCAIAGQWMNTQPYGPSRLDGAKETAGPSWPDRRTRSIPHPAYRIVNWASIAGVPGLGGILADTHAPLPLDGIDQRGRANIPPRILPQR